MNKRIIIFIVIGLFAISCEDKVLNKSPREFFSEVDVWEDIELVKKFQNTIYDGLGYWAIGSYIVPYAVASDEAKIGEDLGIYFFNRGEVSSDNMGRFEPVWGMRYNFIRKANIFLNRIDEVEGASEEEKSVLKGEVKFIRARMYFDLIKLFGGVPLITDVFELSDEFSASRNGYEEIVDWIVKELE